MRPHTLIEHGRTRYATPVFFHSHEVLPQIQNASEGKIMSASPSSSDK